MVLKNRSKIIQCCQIQEEFYPMVFGVSRMYVHTLRRGMSILYLELVYLSKDSLTWSL